MKIKRFHLRYLAIIFIVIIGFSLVGENGFIALYRTHKQINFLENEINNSNNVIDSLKNEIERLKNDTSFIEKIAREKYGMAKKNEKIIKFVEEKE